MQTTSSEGFSPSPALRNGEGFTVRLAQRSPDNIKGGHTCSLMNTCCMLGYVFHIKDGSGCQYHYRVRTVRGTEVPIEEIKKESSPLVGWQQSVNEVVLSGFSHSLSSMRFFFFSFHLFLMTPSASCMASLESYLQLRSLV